MLENYSFLEKIIHYLNIIVALLLLCSFIVPYFPPSTFPTFSLLSLAVSPLIVFNFLFLIYWLFRFKKSFFVSGAVLCATYFYFNPFYKISTEGNTMPKEHSLSILSYNVRLFNAYEEHVSATEVKKHISNLINTNTPDIICIQEYYKKTAPSFKEYPYQFIHFKNKKQKLGHAIFSKYPLIQKKGFDFKDSFNNTIYADVVVDTDTLRLYNLHLQSLGILPSVAFLQKKGTERIKNKISQSFVRQQEQVKFISESIKKSSHPVIIAGDFNNTPFSYIYNTLKKEMNDAFLEKGNGLGTTYRFEGYPMRIDYILSSKKLEILKFKTIKNTFSDHYPITTTIGW